MEPGVPQGALGAGPDGPEDGPDVRSAREERTATATVTPPLP